MSTSTRSATGSKRQRAGTVGASGAASKRNRVGSSDGSESESNVDDQSNDRAADGDSDHEPPPDPVHAVAKRARSAGRARPTAAQKRARFLEKFSGKTPEDILGEYNYALPHDLRMLTFARPYQMRCPIRGA